MKNKYIHPVERLHDDTETVIHPSAFIHPTAYIHSGTKIGKNVAIMEHAVIGPRGMTFNVFEDENHWRKIGKLCWRRPDADYPVIIEDDVYIGAKSIVIRGTKWNTRIGKGTVIALDVSIGHDTIIGEHCLILTKAMTCGSVRVGNFVRINPASIIHNGKTIGSYATIGIGSLVMSDVPPHKTYVGRPAVDLEVFQKRHKFLKELTY